MWAQNVALVNIYMNVLGATERANCEYYDIKHFMVASELCANCARVCVVYECVMHTHTHIVKP